MTISPARVAAWTALTAVDRMRAPLPTALAGTVRRLADPRDRALAHQIVMGTERWAALLDHVIEHYAGRRVARIDPELLTVLRLSAFQILFLSKVPERAAVDEAGHLTRRAGKTSAVGFVNGVLRAIARHRDTLPLPARPMESASSGPSFRQAALDYLSITLSHPRWLADRWLTRFDLATAEAWARFNNTEPRLCLCVNPLKTDVESAAEMLFAEGIEVEPARFAPYGLVVKSGNPLRSPLADTGLFFVQDEASQLVGVFVGARPGERVLDACASPGGKTVELAGQMMDRGTLIAADLRSARTATLARTIERSGAHSVRIVRLDLSRPLPFRTRFDCVLVDAACSGLGTLRRDPDIKWRRQPEDLPRFAERQLSQLEHAATVVAPAGRLIYATCSSEPDENDRVVSTFLARHEHFHQTHPKTLGSLISRGLEVALDPRGFLRTAPHTHDLEGFFAALLVRAA